MNLQTFVHLYAEWISINGNGRNKNDLRFGQFVCNNYDVPTELIDAIYYAEEANMAFNRILANNDLLNRMIKGD